MAAETSQSEEEKISWWVKKDITAIDEFMDPNCMIHSPLGDYIGQYAMKNVMEAWIKGFPDLKVENLITISEKDRVVLQWKAYGTHLG